MAIHCTLEQVRDFRKRFDASMRQAFIDAGLDPDRIERAVPFEERRPADVRDIPETFKEDLRALGMEI